jgi:hypothetical protein
MELNLYDFYNKGYAVTTLSDELIAQLWRIMYLTEWKTNPDNIDEDIPNWLVFDGLENTTSIPTEQLAVRKYLFNTPLELKVFGETLKSSGYFDPLLSALATGKHHNNRWINNVEILSYLPRRNSCDLPWHTDYNGAEDFFVIIYLLEPSENMQGGDIWFGKEDENGHITTIGMENPKNGKAICVNCLNPYFKHKVTKTQDYTRYALNIKFRINKL